MKIIKKSLVVLLLIGSISIISCGDDDSSDDDPAPYVKFSGGSYGANEWSVGLSDYADGVPAGSDMFGFGGNGFNAIALKMAIYSGSFAKNSTDHVYIYTMNFAKIKHTGGSCVIGMRVNSGSQITLTSATREVELTEVTDSYVKGTFKGLTPSSEMITGSFLFKRAQPGDYPLLDPLN